MPSPSLTGEEQNISPNQAAAFLKTLWPEGEHAYLANHTRTYFEALLGPMPLPLSMAGTDPKLTEIAEILRQIATHIDEAAQ